MTEKSPIPKTYSTFKKLKGKDQGQEVTKGHFIIPWWSWSQNKGQVGLILFDSGGFTFIKNEQALTREEGFEEDFMMTSSPISPSSATEDAKII